MDTPEFKDTHLWDRLCWAKENIEPYESKYRVLFEDPNEPDEPAKVLCPDPNWMGCALNGGILPPVWVYGELAKDESKPDFKKHTRGYLLHETEPVPAMTEEEAIEYLIQKDIAPSVWRDYKGNRTIMKIVPVELIPSDRSFRNAWRIAQ